MNDIKVGYARVSTAEQDLTAQRDALVRLGVQEELIFVDHGLTGTNRARPGLREALASVRAGDTFVVTKLDRLARSLRDARDIADELTAKGVVLSLGGSLYDPSDPIGKLLFNVLGMVAEFETDLIRMRTREGMAVARAKGKLKGKQPKLSRTQRAHLYELVDSHRFTQAELAGLFSVSRTTIYREEHRRTKPSQVRPRADQARRGESFSWVQHHPEATCQGQCPKGSCSAQTAEMLGGCCIT